MTHGSLFSGIGGFDLAAEWMGWENKFHCEWNEFGQKVLNYYWPNAECFGDITKTDFTKYNGTIDIISGGFPCQPFSVAGKRKGKEDDRHLWPEMFRAIRQVQPRWIVGENVFGIVNWSRGLVFHEVQTDLETAGYEVFPYVLPSASINSDDERYRCWFVAYSNKKPRRLRFFSKNYDTETRGQWNQEVRSKDRQQFKLASDSTKTLTQWAGRPSFPEFYDGLPTRLDVEAFFKESNNAYGNAINPKVVYQIFKTIQQYENLKL